MRKPINYTAGRTPRITVDWSKKLKDGEEIIDSGWTLDRNGGEMLADEDFDETSSSVTIQKGRPANQYALDCHAETSEGRKLKAEYWLTCLVPPAPPAETEVEPEVSVVE